MTRQHPHPVRIARNGHQMTRPNPNMDWFYADTIEGFCQSKQSNYNRAYQERGRKLMKELRNKQKP